MTALTFYVSYELSTIDHIFDQIIHFKSPCRSYALFEVIRHLPNTLGALVCTLRLLHIYYHRYCYVSHGAHCALNGRYPLYVLYLPSEW